MHSLFIDTQVKLTTIMMIRVYSLICRCFLGENNVFISHTKQQWDNLLRKWSTCPTIPAPQQKVLLLLDLALKALLLSLPSLTQYKSLLSRTPSSTMQLYMKYLSRRQDSYIKAIGEARELKNNIMHKKETPNRL